MNNLTFDSLEILKENNDHLEVIYGWMDIGSNICEKQRNNISLHLNEIDIINKLANMMNRIKLVEDIILYRGINENFNPLIAEKQFNALTPDSSTSKLYGENVMKVIVPKGSNIFHISSWYLINTDVDLEDRQEEVVLFPGKFLPLNSEDNYVTYLYQQL